MKKIILSDCDGVMLDWEKDFKTWMQRRGHDIKYSNDYKLHHHFHDINEFDLAKYVDEFCASDEIARLEAYRDAREYVWKLYKQHGYRIRVITSIGTDPETRRRREENLKNHFGEAIESVICLEAGSAKDLILEPYRNSGLYWIEDKYENFLAGVKLGLTSILMLQEYNRHHKIRRGLVAEDWWDIYKIVTGKT